jgi:hypothetical protein
MARITARTKPKVKRTARKPVKAGSTNRGGNGGILTAKVVAIVNKKKNG